MADTIKYGIVCAMAEEVVKIVNAYDLQQSNQRCEYNTYVGDNIVLIESSIGKIASSLATAILINDFNVDTIINIGIAGALKDTKTDTAYFIESVAQHDVIMPFAQYQVDMFQTIDCVIPPKLLTINDSHKKLATGDQFITDTSSIPDEYDLVDMEGFAVAYVAQRYSIPIIMIKGVSDDANSQSEDSMFDNLNKAMDQTIALLLRIITK
jgi:5'-methylthioadenosine/S-adenosylhomocysteine nucleosidase